MKTQVVRDFHKTAQYQDLRGLNVRFRKIGSGVKERKAGDGSDGVRHAIAEIETGGMPSLTVAEERIECDVHVLLGEGNQPNIHSFEGTLHFDSGDVPKLAGEHHRGLKRRRRADQDRLGAGHFVEQVQVSRLTYMHRDQRGTVEHHRRYTPSGP